MVAKRARRDSSKAARRAHRVGGKRRVRAGRSFVRAPRARDFSSHDAPGSRAVAAETRANRTVRARSAFAFQNLPHPTHDEMAEQRSKQRFLTSDLLTRARAGFECGCSLRSLGGATRRGRVSRRSGGPDNVNRSEGVTAGRLRPRNGFGGEVKALAARWPTPEKRACVPRLPCTTAGIRGMRYPRSRGQPPAIARAGIDLARCRVARRRRTKRRPVCSGGR
jgi:hypothetical protein